MNNYKLSRFLIISSFFIISLFGLSQSAEALTPPTISSVVISNASSGWTLGTSKYLNFKYANLTEELKSVAITLCHPTKADMCTNLGSIFKLSANTTTGSALTMRTLSTSLDSTYLDNSQARIKVCPATLAGSIPAEAVCALTAPFKVITSTTNPAPVTPVPIVVTPPVVEKPLPATKPVTPPTTAVINPYIGSVNIADIASGWSAGTAKTINFSYANFSGSTNSITVSICHPDNRTVCLSFPPSPELLSLTGGGNKSIERTHGPQIYQRLVARDATLTPYFNDSRQTVIKICPANSTGEVTGNCAFSSPYAITPPAASPAISNVSGVGSTWVAGTSKTINFNYSSFAGDTKTVVVSFCHPTTAGVCSALPIGESLNLTGAGSSNIAKSIGAQVYARLTAHDPALTPYYQGYTTRLKVCPASVAGVVPTGATCANQQLFTVTPPLPPTPEGDFNPSGQGCLRGECVCYQGMRMRCGQPMQPGTGCTIPTGCRAYSPPVHTTSLPSRLTASVASLFDSLINIVR